MDENIIEIDHYNGISLESYIDRQGTTIYGLVAWDKGSGEQQVWYKRWVWRSRKNKQTGKFEPDTSKKSIPVSVRLGRKDDAINLLRKIAAQINSGQI